MEDHYGNVDTSSLARLSYLIELIHRIGRYG